MSLTGVIALASEILDGLNAILPLEDVPTFPTCVGNQEVIGLKHRLHLSECLCIEPQVAGAA